MAYLDLFEDWPDTETFESQAIIYSEDDSADSLFVILDGEVDLSYHGDSLGVERRGGLIGEMAVLDGANRTADVIAVEDTDSLVLSSWDFRSFMEAHPEVALEILPVVVKRFRETNEALTGMKG